MENETSLACAEIEFHKNAALQEIIAQNQTRVDGLVEHVSAALMRKNALRMNFSKRNRWLDSSTKNFASLNLHVMSLERQMKRLQLCAHTNKKCSIM
jgi:hypothetical protein